MKRANCVETTWLLAMLVLLGLACSAVSVVPAPGSSVAGPTATASPRPVVVATSTLSEPSPAAWIAFANKNNVWLIHPDGTGLTQLTDNPLPTGNDLAHNNIRLQWSPDGQKLAFSQDNRLYQFDATTAVTKLLVENTPGGFDWSRSSDEIVYDTFPVGTGQWMDNGLWVTDVARGTQKQIVAPRKSDSGYLNPRWSFDSSHLLYTISGLQPSGYGLIDLTTGASYAVPVSPMGGMGQGDCEWSPLKLRLACITMAESSYRPVLRLIDADGRTAHEVTLPDRVHVSDSSLAWSPDGTRLSITYFTGSADFLTRQAATDVFSLASEEVRSLGVGRASGWSPDGQWVVAYNLPWSGDQTPLPMAAINVASAESRPIAEGFYPAWQPLQGAASTLAPGDLATTGKLCTSALIGLRHADKGDFLQMCADDKPIEVGPLAGGASAMGPNRKFFVYCSNSGACFAARVGGDHLTPIGSVKNFAIIRKGQAPELEFAFLGTNPYTVRIFERILQQNETLRIPTSLSAP